MTLPALSCDRIDIHGVQVTLHAEGERLRCAATDMLQQFAMIGGAEQDVQAPTSRPADIVVHLTLATPPTLPEDAHLWIEQAPLRLLTAGSVTYLQLDGRLLAKHSVAEGLIEAWIPADLVDCSWKIGHGVLLPLLGDALRIEGLMPIHAAALAFDGRAVLFPAESGSGKTTLTLALLRRGFALLSDDSPFLRAREGHIEVLAFPERVNVTSDTAKFFPELRSAWAAGIPDPRGKVPVDAMRVYNAPVVWTATPRAIVFPQIGGPHSEVQPLGKTEALFRLLPLTGCSASPSYAQTQFTVVSNLVATTPCYTLSTGQDFDAVPQLIADLLDVPSLNTTKE